jgi:soluble lytic murein transglycosylase-like protein
LDGFHRYGRAKTAGSHRRHDRGAAVWGSRGRARRRNAARSLPLARWHDLIAAASRTFEIPEPWIAFVMRVESAGQETVGGRPITSSAGAMGLMQIMPNTWEGLRSRYGLGNDPYNPHDNIFAGAAYLRELYQRYGYPNLFAAYNAGPERLEAYLRGANPLPAETRSYLAKLGGPSGAREISTKHEDVRLFFELSVPAREPSVPASGGLFVVLRTVPHSQ